MSLAAFSHPAPDRARTIIVLAKEPRPGHAKTRLQAAFSAFDTADLAARCIEDTLGVVRRSAIERQVIAWDGGPSVWTDGFEVTTQPSGTLNDRLTAAFVASSGHGVATLLIGMDTPQVSASQLESDWHGSDAVLGLSEDGGFWAIGLRGGDPAVVFDGVEMSTARTGSAQLARLLDLGYSVRLLPPLRDIDEPADAEAIAYAFPDLAFSRRHRELVAARTRQPVDRIFDAGFTGGGLRSSSSSTDRDPLAIDVGRWAAGADVVDQMVVSRCEAPVIDLGCGPGRMVVALGLRGYAALGIDSSAAAVAATRGRGGSALRHGVFDPLPAEGQWRTVLLVDSNIGIGGDVRALLQRCRDLVVPGGLVLCEVSQSRDLHETHDVVLASGPSVSTPLRWSSIGADALREVAAGLDLWVAEEWSADGRVFVALRRAL